MAGLFGRPREREVYLFVREVLRLEEGNALLKGRARNGGILKDYNTVRLMLRRFKRVRTMTNVQET